MTDCIVLGAGMVGRVIAADLVNEGLDRVVVADRDDAALRQAARRAGGRVETVRADLADPAEVRRLVEPHGMVFGALASRIGFEAMRAVIEAGKSYCDISFMPEDALDLDGLAKERGATVVPDCGVAPGLSNLLAGAAAERLDPCERIEIYVGGIPERRVKPFEYKAAFAPADVLEEYTRPARLVEGGRVVVREALSDVEPLDLPGVGTVEAFNTDGLRSLAHTLDVPFMKEKTIRWPGHADLMRAFREAGLFSKTPLKVGSGQVAPLEVTSAALFPKWTYEEGEVDLTVMRVTAQGRENGAPVRLTWNLLDRYDSETKTTSMARTTAFPCSVIGQMIAAGTISAPGVIPAERLGADEALLESILNELAARRVDFVESRQAI